MALTAHPAVDRATARAWCVEQRRPVVGLGPLLVDVLERAGGRQVALVTPPDTRLTFPLETAPARWVVRGDAFSDGLTGAPLRWDGEAFAKTGPAPAGPSSGPEGALRLDVTARHPADALTDVGGLVEEAAAVLLGGAPTGWGVAEPVTQPWSRRDVTRFCRDRAPSPSTLVVVAGPHAVGLLTVRLTEKGVHERLRLAVGSRSGPGATHTVGSRSGPDPVHAVDAVAAALLSYGARGLSATWHPGRADATRAAGPAPRPVPLGMLVAPERWWLLDRADPPFAGSGGWVRLGAADPHAELCRLTAALAGTAT